jgi:hypothetical protein
MVAAERATNVGSARLPGARKPHADHRGPSAVHGPRARPSAPAAVADPGYPRRTPWKKRWASNRSVAACAVSAATQSPFPRSRHGHGNYCDDGKPTKRVGRYRVLLCGTLLARDIRPPDSNGHQRAFRANRKRSTDYAPPVEHKSRKDRGLARTRAGRGSTARADLPGRRAHRRAGVREKFHRALGGGAGEGQAGEGRASSTDRPGCPARILPGPRRCHAVG